MTARMRNLLSTDAVNHLNYNICMYKLGFNGDCIGKLCGYKYTRSGFVWNLPKMGLATSYSDKENVQNLCDEYTSILLSLV